MLFEVLEGADDQQYFIDKVYDLLGEAQDRPSPIAFLRLMMSGSSSFLCQ